MNLTKDSYFIDTNVVIYLFDKECKEKSDISRAMLKHALQTGKGCLSFQIIQEFCNVALEKFKKPLTPADCKYFIDKYLFPICSVFPGTELYSTALDIKDKTGFGFYDSLVVSCAAFSKSKILYTEDLQDGYSIMGVNIKNPFL